MRIVRDEQGRISEIIKDETDGDFNIETILKIESDEKIAKEKEKTIREEKRGNFLKEFLPIAAKAIVDGIDEYNRQQSISNGASDGLNASEDDY